MGGLFDAFQQMGSAHVAGQKILQEMDERKADTAYKQQLTEGAKLQNADKERQIQNDRALAEWMASDNALQEGQAATARDTAEQFGRAAKFAADNANFDGAKKMSDLASGQIAIAGKAQQQQEKEQVDRAEALSTAAQDVLLAPTPENHKVLYQKAITAGVPPADIPLPGSAGYATFANQAALGAMKGKARLEFMEKMRETEERAKERKENELARRQEKEEARKDRAAAREVSAALARDSLDIRKKLAESTLEARAAKGEAEPKLSATMERQATAVTNAANEAGQALVRMSQMNTGNRASVFNHLEDPKTVLKALTTTGTHKLQTEEIQMMGANLQLLGLEVAQAMAAPYKPNKEQISEARRMVEPIPGDTEYTAMYRMALASDVMKARLESVPRTKTLAVARDHAEASFAKFPTATEVYEHAKQRGIKLKLRKEGTTFMEKLQGMTTPEPAAAVAPAVAAKRQSLLDLYPAPAAK